MPLKCLLVETTDKKRFFTLVKNQKQLMEYCHAFNAKMFVVSAEIQKSKILDLNKLVPALCDKNYKNCKIEFDVIEKKKIKRSS